MMHTFHCPRCGTAIPNDRLVCPKCSPSLSTRPSTPIGGDEDSDASLTLNPNDPVLAVNLSTPRTKEQTRLLTWLAVAIVIACFTTGVLYTLFYLRVGNDVSQLLPKDTLAYALIERPGELREAFQNLEVWTNTRPVRSSIRRQESQFVSQFLLDLGINRYVFGIIQDGVTQAHIALIPGTTDEKPVELLIFCEFDDQTIQDAVEERLSPFFEDGGREGGRAFQIRRLSESTVTLVSLDGLVVLGLGTTAGIRSILSHLESRPTGTLHDVEAFRSAWRSRGQNSNGFVYTSRPAAKTLVANGMGPILHTAINPLANALEATTDGNQGGLTLDLVISGGQENGALAIHSAKDGFALLESALGTNARRLLSAVPVTAEFGLAVSVTNPDALFAAVTGPLIEGLSRMGLINVGPPPYAWLNQLQAESGVYFRDDLLAHISREVAIALVPDADTLSWLFLADLQVPQRALRRLSKVVTQYVRTSPQAIATKVALDEQGLHRAEIQTERDGSPETVLCWALESSTLILAAQCNPVLAARNALRGERGFNTLPSVRKQLAAIENSASAVIFSRIQPLFQRMLSTEKSTEPLAAKHVMLTGLHVESEHITLSGNLPILSTLYVANNLRQLPSNAANQSSCNDFVRAACDGLSSGDCDAFREKVDFNSTTACQTGLRTLQALQTASVGKPAP